MKTNRRGFLGVLSAAIGALALPRTPSLPAAPAPAPCGSSEPEKNILAFKDIEPLNTGIEHTGYWTPAHDTYTARSLAGGAVDIPYNFREEFEGPIEMLNVGGRYDGPIIINSKTVEQGLLGYRIPRVTVTATRYRKIL
jgi:hypothetical protein